MKIRISERARGLSADLILSKEDYGHIISKLPNGTARLGLRGRLPGLVISAETTGSIGFCPNGSTLVATVRVAEIGAVARKEATSSVGAVHEWTEGADPWPVLRLTQVPDRFYRDSVPSLPPATRALQRTVGAAGADLATVVSLLNETMKKADASYYLELEGKKRVRLMQEQIVRKQIV